MAITQPGGSLQASATTFQGDSALSGGSVFLRGSATAFIVAQLADSSITGSLAAAITPHGGGVTAYYASIALVNTSVTGCAISILTPQLGPFETQRDLSPFGSGAGGGLFLFATNLDISQGSLLALNSAVHGGALYLTGRNSSVRLDLTTFLNNTATGSHGGALYLDNIASAVVTGGTAFQGNKAKSHGGALFMAGVPLATFANVSAVGNTCAPLMIFPSACSRMPARCRFLKTGWNRHLYSRPRLALRLAPAPFAPPPFTQSLGGLRRGLLRG